MALRSTANTHCPIDGDDCFCEDDCAFTDVIVGVWWFTLQLYLQTVCNHLAEDSLIFITTTCKDLLITMRFRGVKPS